MTHHRKESEFKSLYLTVIVLHVTWLKLCLFHNKMNIVNVIKIQKDKIMRHMQSAKHYAGLLFGD